MRLLEEALPAHAGPRAVFQPASESAESRGTVAVVMDFVGGTLPQLDQLLETMRLRPDGPGRAGSLFQWSRATPDGVRVTEVWESPDYFEAFLNGKLRPCLYEAGLREPEITTYDVHSYLTHGPAGAYEAGDDVMDGGS